MRRAMCVAVGLAAAIAAAGESVSVPWDEVKELHRQSVERGLMDKLRGQPEERRPQVYSLEHVEVRLSVTGALARGEARVAGRVIAGGPEPIPLFAGGLAVAEIRRASGGTLVCPAGRGPGIFFMPEGGANFEVELDFVVPARDDARSRMVSLDLPAAVRRSLVVDLPAGWRLVEPPGFPDAGGVFRLGSEGPATVRYAAAAAAGTDAAVEVDVLSRLHWRGDRLMLTALLAPARPGQGPLRLKTPAGFRWTGTTLPRACAEPQPSGELWLSPPDGAGPVFAVDFAAEAAAPADGWTLALPSVAGNTGREGLFVVEEPEDARVEVSAAADAPAPSAVPAGRLRPELRPGLERNDACRQLAPGRELRVSLARLAAVPAPPVVLEQVRFFAAFEENGGRLCVLQMDVPAEAGPRLRVQSVPGAEVWSLRVNGERRAAYVADEAWVIPLAADRPSRVELAFLCRGDKLGLQGRLEAVLPRTGLPARRVVVGLALPARVELLSVEGPVAPDPQAAADPPGEFAGRPYLFSRAFDQGEGMRLALAYREPVGKPLATE